jgi:hypothetical protein
MIPLKKSSTSSSEQEPGKNVLKRLSGSSRAQPAPFAYI